MQQPAALREATLPNLARPVAELIEPGTDIIVTDPELATSLTVSVTYAPR